MLFPIGPVAGALIAGGISGIAGLFGGERKNKVDQREALKNRQFQERMRNTSWQAGVADMEAAGLNPALAYQQGGANTPGGSSPPGAENTVGSAIAGMQAQKGLKLLNARVKEAEGRALSTQAQGRMDDWRARYLMMLRTDGQKQGMLRLLNAELGSAEAGAHSARAIADRNRSLASMTGVPGGVAGTVRPFLDSLWQRGAAAAPSAGRAAAFDIGRGWKRVRGKWVRLMAGQSLYQPNRGGN